MRTIINFLNSPVAVFYVLAMAVFFLLFQSDFEFSAFPGISALFYGFTR